MIAPRSSSAFLCKWWATPLLRVALPGLVFLGCNGCEKKPAPPSTAPSEESTRRNPQEKKASAPLQAPPGVEVSFEDALLRVEQVRGLKKKAPVQGLLVAEADLAEHLERALAFERPDQVLEGTEQMLVLLGLVDRDFKLEDTMIKLLHENLAGLYEPRLKLMMVRKDLPEQTAHITLLHELVHALQDQYFDLEEIVTSHPDDTDKSSALSCLAEGDATSTMLDGVLPNGKTALDLPDATVEAQFFSQAPKTEAPPIIVRSLYAPYLDGFKFVQGLRRRGGFEAVNQAFVKPPLSTEHILHDEKYLAYEAPKAVPVPAPPEPGYELLLHDIWGEQSLRLALEEWMPMDAAAQAAAGWGGDRIVVYSKHNKLAVAWHIEMDSEADAAELKAAWLRTTPGDATANQPTGCVVAKNGVAHGVAQKGSHVLIASGPAQRSGESHCADAQNWVGALIASLPVP